MTAPNGQLTIEPGAELPWPCRHLDDPAAPDCHPMEHCCGYGETCPRHHDEGEAA